MPSASHRPRPVSADSDPVPFNMDSPLGEPSSSLASKWNMHRLLRGSQADSAKPRGYGELLLVVQRSPVVGVKAESVRVANDYFRHPL
jgi:hypothetical protein